MNETLKEKLKSPTYTTPCLVMFVILAMQLSKYALTTLQSDTNVFVAVGVIQLAVLGLPCIVYYLLKGKKLAAPIQLLPRRGPNVLFLVFAAMFFVAGMLVIKFICFVNDIGVASLVNFYKDFSGTAKGAGHLEIIVSLIIIPAFCEEFFFRGIVLSEYRKYGTANGVIISALCFAMLHFSIENFFIYLFAGLLLGFVASVSRSIIPSIALHVMSNTLSIYGSDEFLRTTVVKNGAYFIGFVLVVFAGLSLVLMLSRVENILYSYAERPLDEAIPPKSISNFTKVFFSPAFLLLVAAFVCVTVFL